MVVVYSLQFIDALNVIGLSKLLNESTCLKVTVMVVLSPCVHRAPRTRPCLGSDFEKLGMDIGLFSMWVIIWRFFILGFGGAHCCCL